MTQRRAGPADVDDMGRIGLQAMPLDPQWNYRYRHRKEYPKDHEKYIRRKWQKYFDNNDGKWTVNLIDMPSNEDSDDEVFGDKQFHLQLLATDPDYQGRRAASKLRRWGLDYAARHDWFVTLLQARWGLSCMDTLVSGRLW
ncbi:hypothetical protein AYL99_00267 [Fonsecaea erecta]|uniref:N-acetyltransferase domain-containing protein n=1 Tax=Fonsecaea erecta TaxID=1367422 RepID=A0A178ZZ48_9EURO|nr:hypothetical protein AYL99_00267 [Fonsecaea erecta]OAP64295.1 hypothetical protein AYL99_00267 [Fonsecaea erecta]